MCSRLARVDSEQPIMAVRRDGRYTTSNLLMPSLHSLNLSHIMDIAANGVRKRQLMPESDESDESSDGCGDDKGTDDGGAGRAGGAGGASGASGAGPSKALHKEVTVSDVKDDKGKSKKKEPTLAQEMDELVKEEQTYSQEREVIDRKLEYWNGRKNYNDAEYTRVWGRLRVLQEVQELGVDLNQSLSPEQITDILRRRNVDGKDLPLPKAVPEQYVLLSQKEGCFGNV